MPLDREVLGAHGGLCWDGRGDGPVRKAEGLMRLVVVWAMVWCRWGAVVCGQWWGSQGGHGGGGRTLIHTGESNICTRANMGFEYRGQQKSPSRGGLKARGDVAWR